jgi:uncharacterized membrane protein
MRRNDALFITIAAIMIAVTAVFTWLVRVPIHATQGYFNFSDVAVYFAAFAFGPILGTIAGGVGTAIADLLAGFPQWALLTFLAHGSQGLVAGWLGRGKKLPGLIVAWIAGALCMAGIYLLGEGLILTGWGPALAELPFNLLQNLVGGVVGIRLFYAVRKAYPSLMRMGQPTTWREE